MNEWVERVRPGLVGFRSLRTKLVLYTSLIIVAACSALSWFFVQGQTEAMTRSLLRTGTLLAGNLASSGRYSLIAEDRPFLQRLSDSAMGVDDVVYVVMTIGEGPELVTRTKGSLTDRATLTRSRSEPLFPDTAIARALFGSGADNTVITPFRASHGETIYDFAVAVRRRSQQESLAEVFSLEPQPPADPAVAPSETPGKVYAVVQVGLSASHLQQDIATLITRVFGITLLIILLGLGTTIVLANRIVTPIRSLAAVAKRIAEGDLAASVVPRTHDEIGELTNMFNQMTRSLSERDLTLSAQMQIIVSQVKQLTALNQTSLAIVSTLDVDKLLTTVMRLLVENLSFSRIGLLLYDHERGVLANARVSGFPREFAATLRDAEFAVANDGGLLAEVVLHGRPVVVQDLTTVAERLPRYALDVATQLRVGSFVAVPLLSKQTILGLLVADRGALPCQTDDVELLTTIASQIGVAMDNARAYLELELLNQTLDQRVRQRTQELQTANEQLRELDQLKSAFVSIVSHELRTPMTSIKGYVENMLEGLTGALTERQSHYLQRVKYNVERLTRLINDLLDLSRIETGRVELRQEWLCIRDLTNEVVDSFQAMAQAKGLNITVQHPATMPRIKADRDKLIQVLTNLVQNAVKFTPQGGHVRLQTQTLETGFVQVSVQDTGCGIRADEMDKVFLRFYRGESAPSEARGAGLGLTIAKSLVELHGGRIWVESSSGEGSRFIFIVPVAHDHNG